MRAFVVLGPVLLAACGGDSTAPPKAVSIVFVGDNNQSGTVGQAIVPGPKIEIRDAAGAVLSGVAFTVRVSGGGTLTGTPAKTIPNNPTALGTWTLGNTAGAQSLTVSSAGVSDLTIPAVATAGPAATSSSGGQPTVSSGRVGEVSVSHPQIKILDSFGNPVTGLAVVVTILGGGSVQFPVPITGSDGVASVGTWTLGTTAGTQRVTLAVAGAPSVAFTATVEAASAATTVASSAVISSGSINTQAPFAPAIRVTDQYGNGIPGVPVSVQLGSGSGSVTNPNPVTDATGEASAGVWTLGALAGDQTVTMSALSFPSVQFSVAASAGFTMEVRFVGGTPPTNIQTAIATAAARMQRIITADLPDNPVNISVGTTCNSLFNATINQLVDDLVIFAQMATVDGPGGTLAFANRCVLRQGSPNLPLIGYIVVDAADAGSSSMTSIILHEMFHALGIGTLWRPSGLWTQNLLQGVGTNDPVFTGPQAFASYVAAGGISTTGVAVENCIGIPGCGQATINSHWRELVFRTEIMTGFIDNVSPVSAITISSLADLGYTVSLAQADAYTVPAGGQPAGSSLRGPLVPIIEPPAKPPVFVGPDGRVLNVQATSPRKQQ